MIRRPLSALLLSLLVCACTPRPDIASQQAALSTSPVCADAGPCIEVADPIPLSEACPLDRVIAIDPSGVCPLPNPPPTGGIWAVAPLFPGAPGVLGTYCAYDWVSAGGPPDTSGLPPHSADCNVVTAMTTNAEIAAAPLFEQSFLHQVGAVSHLTKAGAPSPTRVAVVDSAVRSGPPHATAGRVSHGLTMQQIIDRLACPNPTDPSQLCAASLYSTLALPLRDDATGLVRDHVSGGYFGSQTDLAVAIYQAISDMRAAPGGDRMIVNLSVAWPPEYGGAGAPSTFLTPVAAVRDALRYAACEGALVFASSGNQPGGPSPSIGPAYPAGWETLWAPTPAECASDFWSAGPPPAATPYRPLLYAIGGVDHRDETLAKARGASRPVLVAPAEHVTVTDRWSSGSAAISTSRFHSGTSIGPAVASGAAALVWSLRPSLSAHDVAKVLHDSAVVLIEPSDFQLGPPVPSRRLSVCEATRQACVGSPFCGSSVACASPPAYGGQPPSGLPSATPSATVAVSGADLTHSFDFGAPCNAPTVTSTTTPPTHPCPAQQLYHQTAGPWVHPQGPGPVCTVCFVHEDSLKLNLADDFEGALSSPTLTIVDINDEEARYKLDLGEEELTPGSRLEVTDLPFEANDLKKAAIEFVIDGKLSSSDPLLLEP